MLSFKPTFLSPLSLSSRGSSVVLHHKGAIRVVSSALLRLSIFLPAILIPACASSSPAQTETCATRTQVKGAVTPQETDPDLPVSVQEALGRRGSAVACYRVGGTECSSACMGPFDRGPHCPHYLQHSLAPGQITGRETASPINRKLG